MRERERPLATFIKIKAKFWIPFFVFRTESYPELKKRYTLKIKIKGLSWNIKIKKIIYLYIRKEILRID